jgi:hypothetical protein
MYYYGLLKITLIVLLCENLSNLCHNIQNVLLLNAHKFVIYQCIDVYSEIDIKIRL